MIQIDPASCVGCGLCVSDCFPGALCLTGGKAALAEPGSCIGCGHCIAICPMEAVTDEALPWDDVIPCGDAVPPDALLSTMRSRRSCRHFKPESLPEALLHQVIEAARACPTAKNLQGTRYILVREHIPALLDAALETLGEIGLAQQTASEPDERRRAGNFIRWAELRRTDRTFDPLFFHAPALLIFVSDRASAHDAAAGAAYGELMAASLGLGCLYSGYFTACAGASPKIWELLDLGPDETVVRCLVLGYPDVKFQRSAPRKAPDITLL